MICQLDKSSIKDLEKIFKKVFVNNDAFSNCFNKNIKKIQILCPTNGYSITKDQYECIRETTKQIYKERLLYVSEIECEKVNDAFQCIDESSKYKFKHWSLDLSTYYEDYLSLNLNMENVIYSQNGEFGIIVSHEEHALLGTSLDFAKKFNEYYSINKSLKNFIEKWEYNRRNYNSDLKWLYDLLKLTS